MTATRQEVEAFSARMRPQLIGALTRFCGDAQVAEDLAQETLTRVWTHWAQVRAADSPEAWAHHVGRNLATSFYRKRATERRTVERLAADPTRQTPERGAEESAELAPLRAAVSRLPHAQRAPLALRYLAELSVAETATAIGRSEGTVKSQTARALRSLRADLLDTA